MIKLPILTLAAALGVCGTAANAADVVVIEREVTIAASADTVWKRIGDYCAIAEWLKVTCSVTDGAGEDLGSVRLLNGAIQEVMVARSPLSYTYHQTVGNMSAYGYHGTMSVEPTGPSTARLVYILIYDQEAMTPDKRLSERLRLEGRFQAALETMKAMSQGD